jgi:hypothetical protein
LALPLRGDYAPGKAGIFPEREDGYRRLNPVAQAFPE